MERANTKALQKMDLKKGKSASWEAKKVVTFVGEVKQELKKIEWTSKEELKAYTKIVLASTFLFGLFVYSIDLIMRGILSALDGFLKFIGG